MPMTGTVDGTGSNELLLSRVNSVRKDRWRGPQGDRRIRIMTFHNTEPTR